MEEIRTQQADMPTTIHSYCVQIDDGSYVIVINSRLAENNQRTAYLHELGHIHRMDFEKESCDQIEAEAHANEFTIDELKKEIG